MSIAHMVSGGIQVPPSTLVTKIPWLGHQYLTIYETEATDPEIEELTTLIESDVVGGEAKTTGYLA